MVIRWTSPATRQLVAVHEHIAADDEAAATRIVDYIWDSVDILGKHPKAGRPGRVAGTRELVIVGTPFVVAYRVEKNEVDVLAVLHGAQKWPDQF